MLYFQSQVRIHHLIEIITETFSTQTNQYKVEMHKACFDYNP